MKGVITKRSHSGQHVVIKTEDGDYAVARVPGALLQLNALVDGDFINPGPNQLHCGLAAPIKIYLEECRMQEDAAGELMTSFEGRLDM